MEYRFDTPRTAKVTVTVSPARGLLLPEKDELIPAASARRETADSRITHAITAQRKRDSFFFTVITPSFIWA
jgi:hypothetical protein